VAGSIPVRGPQRCQPTTLLGGAVRTKIHKCGISRDRLTLKSSLCTFLSAVVAADWLQLDGGMELWRRDASMPPSQVEIDMRVDGLPEKVHSGVSGDNSAATAKWR